MRAGAVYQVARSDRACQSAEPHAKPNVSQSAYEIFAPDDVEGETLPRSLVHRAEAPAHRRENEEMPDLQFLAVDQRADADKYQRQNGVHYAQEQTAVDHVGDGARRDAEEEEGRHTQAVSHADHESAIGQLEHQPSDDDLLAHQADGVEE